MDLGGRVRAMSTSFKNVIKNIDQASKEIEKLSDTLTESGQEMEHNREAFYVSAGTVGLTHSAILLLQTEAICTMLEEIRKELANGRPGDLPKTSGSN